jgi:tRNA(Ile)-lysidine synthase
VDLLKKLEHHVNSNALFKKENHLLIALSGGVDSMVLAHMCHALNYSITLAHCNFQLRGEESKGDQQFVEKYAQQIGLPLEVKVFETNAYIEKNKLSVQEGARQLRYDWLNELAEKISDEKKLPTYILTAHHADDQAETVMMNFFRGTGLKGLTGIPEKNGRVIRPLLIFRKADLSEYATNHHIQFVEDSSNLTSDYTRNLLRNEILPALENVYPKVKENILNNANRFRSVLALYEKAIKPLLSRIVHQKGNEWHIAIRELFRHNNTSLIYEILHPYGFTEAQIGEVIKLKDAAVGSYIMAPDTRYRLIKDRLKFILAKPQEESAEIIIWEKDQPMVDYPEGILAVSSSSSENLLTSSASAIIQVDAHCLEYPLILRKWKEGDYFYPLGLGKKKKVARFMIDQKFSKTDKEKLWILESQSRIIWLVGYRLDDRFKVTDRTKSVLKIERRVS